MSISVFLSRPNPYVKPQRKFIDEISTYLKGIDLDPNTVGETYYTLNEPLKAIRELMRESSGIITIAFRRGKIERGELRPDTSSKKPIDNQWITSPFCHIETAMAYQLEMPILILREKGVIEDGVLEKGVAGFYLPEFDLNEINEDDYLKKDEWTQLILKWRIEVQKFHDERSRKIKAAGL
ncbi:hypothetical protein FACS1894184_03440 [Clostridia bacterium]|nr:hypothetical protein FACS1894184_03440 [Clostridia bacterium]